MAVNRSRMHSRVEICDSVYIYMSSQMTKEFELRTGGYAQGMDRKHLLVALGILALGNQGSRCGHRHPA